MANSNLVRVGRNVLATESTRDKVGMEMVKVGSFGIGLWFVAGLIPFVTLPMILGMLILAGFFV